MRGTIGARCFLLTLFSVVTILSGCASNVPLESVSISASVEANSSYATIVDLVVLFDKDLAAKVSSMPSSQYFPIADQLERDNEELMLRWRWEVVPGQVISRCPIAFEKYNPLAAFIFARYYTPGDHRKKLTPVQDIAIFLEQEDFKVCELVSGTAKNGEGSRGKTAPPLPQISEDAVQQNARRPYEDPISRRRFRRERLRQRLMRAESDR